MPQQKTMLLEREQIVIAPSQNKIRANRRTNEAWKEIVQKNELPDFCFPLIGVRQNKRRKEASD